MEKVKREKINVYKIIPKSIEAVSATTEEEANEENSW